MRAIRAVISFVVWLFLGWLYLMAVSLVIGGVFAFTVEYFLVSASSPAYVGYLVSGLATFAAGSTALFSTARTKRLVRGVLVAALLLGAADVITALVTRFGTVVPRVGYTLLLVGSSFGVGAQLVNGVALLASVALFVFVRELNRSEQRSAETAEIEPAAATAPEEQDRVTETGLPEPKDSAEPAGESLVEPVTEGDSVPVGAAGPADDEPPLEYSL